MRIKMALGMCILGLSLGACGSRSRDDDDTFANIENADVKDQDSLSLDESSSETVAASPAKTQAAPDASTQGLRLFTQSDERLPVGPQLWNRKWRDAWLPSCRPKKTSSTWTCVLRNAQGEKVVVAVKMAAGLARKIFVDAKGSNYVDHWRQELQAAGFEKAKGPSFGAPALNTKAKMIYVKKLKAATLLLEAK